MSPIKGLAHDRKSMAPGALAQYPVPDGTIALNVATKGVSGGFFPFTRNADLAS